MSELFKTGELVKMLGDCNPNRVGVVQMDQRSDYEGVHVGFKESFERCALSHVPARLLTRA